ncbi:MAG TPA: HAMP domain-containing sensor histidine kinase [Thermoanaerobaculia bacterium]|jgi:signal transduction histidine kinase
MDPWLESFARANFLRSADTAHDLKTPLNVAVLNLELLRMRMRKLTDGSDDPKLIEYASSIEIELRRMARIFDTFFLLSTPPKGEQVPVAVDVVAICVEEAKTAGVNVEGIALASVIAHEPRIRQAFRLFFEGAARLFPTGNLRAVVARDAERVKVTLSGPPPSEDFEPSKIFKFYYTDPLGNADLSLATARLIVETYGGELKAEQESDKVVLRLSVPLGEE